MHNTLLSSCVCVCQRPAGVVDQLNNKTNEIVSSTYLSKAMSPHVYAVAKKVSIRKLQHAEGANVARYATRQRKKTCAAIICVAPTAAMHAA